MRGGPSGRMSRLLTMFDHMSHVWVKKVYMVSLITVHSGGLGSRGVDAWTARSAPPFPLHSGRPRSTVISKIKDKTTAEG
jgi:hypothetical protein